MEEVFLTENLKQAVYDVADKVYLLGRWPYFDLVHFILICVAIRDDTPVKEHKSNTGYHVFSRQHVVSTWLACILSGVAGALIIQAMCGLPITTPLANNHAVAMATTVWYLVFYSPGDLFYRVVKFYPVFLAITLFKEVHRAMLIEGGLKTSLSVFPSGHLNALAAGVVAGAGAGLFRIVDRLIRGIWIPTSHELVKPTFWTKLSALATLLLLVKRQQPSLLPFPYPVLYLGVVTTFLFFRLLTSLLSIKEPFSAVETGLSRLCFGEVPDTPTRSASGTTTADKDGAVSDSSGDRKKKD